VGCGPGRHVAALNELGTPALGVDPSVEARAGAHGREVAVLLRSIFSPIPGEGRWPTALLLDGNVGIGGDPSALLRRLWELVRPGGTVIVETSPPGAGLESTTVRLERNGHVGPWFPWAIVAADHIGAVAAAAGFTVGSVETVEGRWLARLAR
jgi:SAM-dependent methyltransferase